MHSPQSANMKWLNPMKVNGFTVCDLFDLFGRKPKKGLDLYLGYNLLTFASRESKDHFKHFNIGYISPTRK